MKPKNLEVLLIKLLRKLIKQELKKTQDDDIQIMDKTVSQLEHELSEIYDQKKIPHAPEMLNEIPHGEYLNLTFSTEADAELERRLREIKFRQELRKDWIIFLVKDVIVYATTVIFILTFSCLFLVQVLYPSSH